MNYAEYILKRKILPHLKTIFPIIISIAALFLAYKSYRQSSVAIRMADTPTWKHRIDISVRENIFQKITFEPANPDIVLEKLEIILPSPLENEVDSHISKNVWNCAYLQMNLADFFSRLRCTDESIIPHNASDWPISQMPIGVKFQFVKSGELRTMFCYYVLNFRHFPVGKVKIYSLEFIKELETSSRSNVRDYVDYQNKVNGFYRDFFSDSSAVKAVITKTEFKPLYEYLKSLEQISYSTRAEIIDDSSSGDESPMYYPDMLTDSIDLIESVKFIDSVSSRLSANERYKTIREKFDRIKDWVNKDALCFVFKRKRNDSCFDASPWSSERLEVEFVSVIDDVIMEIWKLYTPEPNY